MRKFHLTPVKSGQVRVFDSDWCITVSCCFTAPAELYKSSYSPVSSLKDSGGTRPGGVCARCSCCQHDCSHRRGHSGAADLRVKEGPTLFNTTIRGLARTIAYRQTDVSFKTTCHANLNMYGSYSRLWLSHSLAARQTLGAWYRMTSIKQSSR